MVMWEKKVTNRDLAFAFYKTTGGTKVSFAVFYNKVRKNPQWDWNKLVRPNTFIKKLMGTIKRTWKFQYEMEWYDRFDWPKPTPEVYRCRLSRWLSKEDAIMVGDEWEEARQLRVLKAQIVKRQAREKKREQDELNWINKPQTPTFKRHRPIEDDYDPDLFRIDITYKPAEAKVIRDAYYRTLDELEDEINNEDNKEIKWELEFNYEFVEAQLALFNSYNK